MSQQQQESFSNERETRNNANKNNNGASTAHDSNGQQQQNEETAESMIRITKKNQCNEMDGFHFLSPGARQALPLYQYKGQDLSLLYRYILSPLATYLVYSWTPKTIAPNTITLIGLLWMVTAYLACWYYVPHLYHPSTHQDNELTVIIPPPPRWIYLWNAISLLVYQTLDNMDGKQARRTNSSSPLGLLFDHGCDAINSIFGSANWIISLGLHPIRDVHFCLALVFGPYAMFYIATWEEFYTHELILPIINGPNEGLVGGALLSLTTYFLGMQFWQSKATWCFGTQTNIRNADIQVSIAILCFFREVLWKTSIIVKRYGYKTLWNQACFWILVLASWYLGAMTWTSTNTDSLSSIGVRWWLHLWSGLFCDLATQLMLDHVTGQSYSFRQRLLPLLPLVLLALWTCYHHYQRNDDEDQNKKQREWMYEFLIVYTTAIWTYLCIKICRVIQECCTVLQIFCFDIVTPYPRNNKPLIKSEKQS